MVYCGKPSKGCQNCKTRRIKCDEQRPCCGQCIKSKRECPGYRDDFDLVHRNETAAVKRRAQRTKKLKGSEAKTAGKGRGKEQVVEVSTDWNGAVLDLSPSSDGTVQSSRTRSSNVEFVALWDSSPIYSDPRVVSTRSTGLGQEDARSSRSQHGQFEGSPISDVLVSPRPMDTPAMRVDVAVSFWFRHLLRLPRSPDAMRGYIEVLAPLYMRAKPSSLLHQATHALALAALSNGRRSPLIRIEARNMYAKALRDTGLAIRDPKQARSDELLMSILLFSLYEVITDTEHAGGLWTRHIHGAITMVKMRGESMKSDPISLHLFRAVRAHMLTATISQQKPIEEFPSNKGWHFDDDLPLNAANRLTLICMDLPNIKFYAQDLLVREKTPSTIAEITRLITIAETTDQALEHWSSTLDPAWEPRVKMMIPVEPQDVENSLLWKGPVHLYDDLTVASVWNDYRLGRIFCRAVILGCVASLPHHLRTGQIQKAAEHAVTITQKMVDGFCSSLPFLFGLPSEFEAKKISKPDQIALRAAGAYYAAWPLWVTRNIPTIPENQRKWLAARFKSIGKVWGLTEGQMLNMAQRHAVTTGPQFSHEEYGDFDGPYPVDEDENILLFEDYGSVLPPSLPPSPKPCAVEYMGSVSGLNTFIGRGRHFA